MKIDILTIFPQMFNGVFEAGIARQAQKKGLLTIRAVDLRDFTADRHRTVDDRPFGGGEGMVMKPEPIFRAVESCRVEMGSSHVVLLTPQGTKLNQGKAQELSLRDHLILICGRYEGVDQRVADFLVDEEISVGDFVLSGGEFAAMIVVDAVSRLLPGAVGNASSILEDSFMHGLLDYPHYTRPADFRGMKVPEVLLSGDHDEVNRWRQAQSLKRTLKLRPDLVGEDRESPSETVVKKEPDKGGSDE